MRDMIVLIGINRRY